MKSFLRNVVQRKEASGGGLVGRTVKVGAFTVRVEAHLADGGFACIYRVRDGSTGTAYALKHMRLMGDYEAITDCMTEVNTLKQLREVPSIITLRAAAFTGAKGSEQEAYLLLDLCRDNLVEFMKEHENKISTSKILQVFSSVCQAVAAMHRHSPPLAHRDLKAENVLQHNNGDWVLCDFGSVSDKPVLYESSNAVLMGEEEIRKYTTPAYRAPEMWDLYSRERIDTKADIWSLGCLLYYLMFGKLAFQAEAKLQILKGEISLPPTRPPPLVALLKELLVVNSLQRPDIITVLRRLQEVADALNVDPALLVPRAQPQMPAPGPLTARPPPQEQSQVPVIRASSLKKEPGDQPAGRQPLTSEAGPAAPPVPGGQQQQPQAAGRLAQPLPAPAAVVPPQNSTKRSNSFTKASPAAPLPGLAQQSSTASAEVRGFANFEESAVFLKAREEEPQRMAASPPKTQRSLMRQREPEASTAQLSSELSSLRRQLAELQLQNQQLVTTTKSQQTTIKQLQVDNYNQVLQLKRLGLEPVPSTATKQPAAGLAEAGWASFDGPPAEPPLPSFPAATLTHVRTLQSQPSDAQKRGSPSKQRVTNGTVLRPLSPQSAAAFGGTFDPFGVQPASVASEGLASPSTDPNSANGTPSETLSRHSALSAFAESLKQPALVGDAEGEAGSPLSAAPINEGKARSTARRSHRRSSSEPVPLENVTLVEERFDS